MPTPEERIATLEAILPEIRDDVREIRAETSRTRKRLHSLEGISSSFLAWQKDAREKEKEQYRRLGVRIQVLTLVVGLAAVVVPLLVVLLSR